MTVTIADIAVPDGARQRHALAATELLRDTDTDLCSTTAAGLSLGPR